MMDILIGVLIFAGVVLAHLMVCRLRSKDCLHVRDFFIIAGIGLVALVVILFAAVDAAFFNGMPLDRLPATAIILYVLLMPIYLSFYVLTVLMSPSKKILMSLAQGDLTRGQLLEALGREEFVQTRIKDLIASRMVRQADGRLILTAHGKPYFMFTRIFGMLLGRPQGG